MKDAIRREKLVAEAQPVRHGEVKTPRRSRRAVPALPQHEGKGRGEKAQCGKALPRDIEFFFSAPMAAPPAPVCSGFLRLKSIPPTSDMSTETKISEKPVRRGVSFLVRESTENSAPNTASSASMTAAVADGGILHPPRLKEEAHRRAHHAEIEDGKIRIVRNICGHGLKYERAGKAHDRRSRKFDRRDRDGIAAVYIVFHHDDLKRVENAAQKREHVADVQPVKAGAERDEADARDAQHGRAITLFTPGFLLYTAHARNGTSTQYVAVRKAFFPAVVYTRP